MRYSNLAALALVLAIALPAQAKHAKHSSAKPAVAKAPVVVAPTPVVLNKAMPSSSRPTSRIAMIAPAKPKVAVVKKTAPVVTPAAPAATATPLAANAPVLDGRLARITAYYTQEDYYTSQHMSSTGVHLEAGRHCAVDPNLIPYGSVVTIPGRGDYTAVDTGSAVVSREAALGSAHNATQRNALVIDLFFETRKDAEKFASSGPSFVSVSWKRPLTAPDAPRNPLALPATSAPAEGHAMMQVYVLASAPSLAESRMPLAFRAPVCSFQ